jgi:hypothetical protein
MYKAHHLYIYFCPTTGLHHHLNQKKLGRALFTRIVYYSDLLMPFDSTIHTHNGQVTKCPKKRS